MCTEQSPAGASPAKAANSPTAAKKGAEEEPKVMEVTDEEAARIMQEEADMVQLHTAHTDLRVPHCLQYWAGAGGGTPIPLGLSGLFPWYYLGVNGHCVSRMPGRSVRRNLRRRRRMATRRWSLRPPVRPPLKTRRRLPPRGRRTRT